ncbi:M23 family metallopeptidase [Sphingosinicella rhizophila]|uniref:M23 family metallopeptidase n=1 Tax=Sphingosinicella rhizophila TaxID=3050082 RepID=A0ABU3Q634_9SPHN|nr:M23 family metallopeptidase [Sphingosinicella sp. GR2756]MDT9598865.1 M23 family metallopeptidase [Sphingosinicella sp. GR2756]
MALTVLLASAGKAAPAEKLEIRFCPEKVVRPYPLDSIRGIQGLLVQNIAVVNKGKVPRAIAEIEIALLEGDRVIDTRSIKGPSLDAAVRTAQAVKAQGILELAPFQFCDGRLLGDASFSEQTKIMPGQALLLMQQVFAYRGARNRVRVTARADDMGSEVASAFIPIDAAGSATRFRWPLAGTRTWLVAAAASFHTTHRWAVPEEFALDIIAVDADGNSHSGAGDANADFYAYGADVVAAADGVVAKLVSGGPEETPLLRKPDEAMNAYYARIGERQARNLASGEAGVVGDGVVIDHGNGEYSVYAHLRPGSVKVRVGERVRSGTVIGSLGSSGNSTEPHLHFQICDRPSVLSCAAIPPSFVDILLPAADGDRPVQSGDLVRAGKD